MSVAGQRQSPPSGAFGWRGPECCRRLGYRGDQIRLGHGDRGASEVSSASTVTAHGAPYSPGLLRLTGTIGDVAPPALTPVGRVWPPPAAGTAAAVWVSDAVLVVASDGPPGLLPARQQMAVSLGWHIVLACFGVAFPTMIYVVHRRGIVGGDPVALELAKRWAKVSAVLFAIGAVSGTVLGCLRPPFKEVERRVGVDAIDNHQDALDLFDDGPVGCDVGDGLR